MSKVEDFLTTVEESQIIEAIKTAEKNTSGEIRVHLETSSDGSPIERAKELFGLLKMNETKDQNGVLFYVAVDDRQFAVLGDVGIDKVVSGDFWNSIKNKVINRFLEGNYTLGLQEGILETGKKLQEYFPYESNDIDELPNDISLG